MERTLDDMFWLYSDKCNSNVKVFNSNIIIAENECYGAKYTRAFLFKSDTINCKELIEIEGIKQINFHLHPNVKVKSIDEKSILLSVNSIKNNVIINVVLQNLTKDINSELLIDDFDYFIEDAINCDGRGHFISSYDGEEVEYKYKNQVYYIYRTN
jgi:hypothetical protein